MPFIREQHVGHRDVLGFHRIDDQVGFVLLHAWVIGALADQQGLGDFFGMGQRRTLHQPLPAGFGARIAHALGQLLVEAGPVRRHRTQ